MDAEIEDSPVSVGSKRQHQVRNRPHFSRTLSRARWPEYERLLHKALQCGYNVISLERFLAGQDDLVSPTLVLRHDVDQCPKAVLPMLNIEIEAGVSATWYFRWRTARRRVIEAVRAAGGEVGLHYETLSRMLLAKNQSADAINDSLLSSARDALARELAAFDLLFGPAQSACAHGDTRIPGVNNVSVLDGQDLGQLRLSFEANISMRGHPLDLWLTDRSSAEGHWRDGIDPLEVIAAGRSPVLLLTHPNNWVTGAALWSDRVRRGMLPTPAWESTRAFRSGSDDPPIYT